MNARSTACFAALACAVALCASTLGLVDDALAAAPGPHVARALPSWRQTPDVIAPAAYAGLWDNAPSGSEPGWAIALSPDGDAIAATWFTYDVDGSPMWLALHADDVSALVDGSPPRTVFVGTLTRSFVPPAAAQPATVDYGPAVIEFASPDTANLYYDVDGTWRTKTIVRTYGVDATASCAATARFDGLWTSDTSPSPAGGVYAARAGERVVAVWFTFGVDGKPVWRVTDAAPTASGAYVGALYATRGPALGTPFDAASVHVERIGTASIAFDVGVFAFDVAGTPARIAMRREGPAMRPLCD